MAKIYDYTDAIADKGYLRYISGRAIKVLWTIIRHFNQIKGAYPNITTITKKTGLDGGQIARALDELRLWRVLRLERKIYYTKRKLAYKKNYYYLQNPITLPEATKQMKERVDRVLKRRERFRKRKYAKNRS